MNDFTNFHNYSHADLRKMVQSMDSSGVMAASDPWRKAAQTLKDIRTALNTASLDATSSWEGSTSDAFLSRMSKLANSVNNASAYANDTAVSMQMMSEAIDQAKRDMPEEPGFWDEVTDGAKGFAESAVGMDNATTETSLADRKKAQAVVVMETLAAKYRATTSYLKPPSIGKDDATDLPPPDSSAAEAISALIVGGGLGVFGDAQSSGSSMTSSRPSSPSAGRAPQTPKVVEPGPTDAGIKGGTANPAPLPKTPEPGGPGTGLDGIHGGVPVSATGRSSSVAGADDEATTGGSRGTGAGSGGAVGGLGMGGGGIGQAGGALTGRAGSAFGAGGLDESGSGAGGRAGLGAARKSAGAVGEGAGGGAGKRAFTEGGTGIGRGRGGGQGAAGQGGHGMPGGSAAGKKDKKQGKKRPDYLVEDEETWMSGEKVNPDVVE